MQREVLKTFLCDKADELKAEDIKVVDVIEKSSITDYMIVCTGTSKRHVTAIAEHLALESKHSGLPPLGLEGEKQGEWVVLDMGAVVVHVMQAQMRDLYQLEKLWGLD